MATAMVEHEEPLARVFEVVEQVVAEVMQLLGPDAGGHTNPDRWFARAEAHIRDGTSVAEAVHLMVPGALRAVRAAIAEDAASDTAVQQLMHEEVLEPPDKPARLIMHIDELPAALRLPASVPVEVPIDLIGFYENDQNIPEQTIALLNVQKKNVRNGDALDDVVNELVSEVQIDPLVVPVLDVIDCSLAADIQPIFQYEDQHKAAQNVEAVEGIYEKIPKQNAPTLNVQVKHALLQQKKMVADVGNHAENSANMQLAASLGSKKLRKHKINKKVEMADAGQPKKDEGDVDVVLGDQDGSHALLQNGAAAGAIPKVRVAKSVKKSKVDGKVELVDATNPAGHGSESTVKEPSKIELRREARRVNSVLPLLSLDEVLKYLQTHWNHPRRVERAISHFSKKGKKKESARHNPKRHLKRSHEYQPNLINASPKKTRMAADGEPLAGPSGVMQLHPKEDIGLTHSIRTEIDHGTASQPPNNLLAKWRLEKVDFLCAVLGKVSRRIVTARVEGCNNDHDVEQFLQAVIEAPEQLMETRAEGGAPMDFQEEVTDELDDNPNLAPELDDQLHTMTNGLIEMFPDAAPDFLQDKVKEIGGDAQQYEQLVVQLSEKHNYPKMEEYLRRQKQLEMRRRFIDGMTVEEFLNLFDDPEKIFCDKDKLMSVGYVTNARAQLLTDFPSLTCRDIDCEFKHQNMHYLLTFRALKEGVESKRLRAMANKRSLKLNEVDLDDVFLKELCYTRMQTKIKQHLQQQEESKRLAFLKAKKDGELRECPVCCDDEVLADDMSLCADDNVFHQFCNVCIKKYAEEEIGQGRSVFRCLDGHCTSEFPLPVLKKLLRATVFSNLLQRKQLEEIAAAGIADLESCPFCNFATIMPNAQDKVFQCLNPECMKDSCRICKEPNHVPLRCEEVEKKNEMEARTMLENEMSEAMVRECWRCKMRFIKEDGCNKMSCTRCKALMCYLCKKPIQGYDHFIDSAIPVNGKCALWSNSLRIHAEEVRARAAEVKARLDPDLVLIHDPTKEMPEVPPVVGNAKQQYLADRMHAAHARIHGPNLAGVLFQVPPAHALPQVHGHQVVMHLNNMGVQLAGRPLPPPPAHQGVQVPNVFRFDLGMAQPPLPAPDNLVIHFNQHMQMMEQQLRLGAVQRRQHVQELHLHHQRQQWPLVQEAMAEQQEIERQLQRRLEHIRPDWDARDGVNQ